MASLVQGESTLAVLLKASSLLLSRPDEPRAWNRALRALAASDPFFAGATISVCHLDLEEAVRDTLASYGPQAHELTRKEMSLVGMTGPATRLLSRLREGKALVIYEGWRRPQGARDLLERLLPSPSAKPLVLLPLLSGGRITGACWIEGCDPAEYRSERMRMLRLLGNCLSLALTPSIHQGRGEKEDSVLRAVLEAQERERERIALEVHDGALQVLSSAFQHLQVARDSRGQDEDVRSGLAKAIDLLKEAIEELRGLMGSLRPAPLHDLGLIAAVESDVQGLRQEGWQAELVADAVRLPEDRETTVYRIVHEALTNVRKHAGLCPVRVSLQRRSLWLSVEVRDWGRGFEAAALAHEEALHSFGLLSMRKRAELLGGRFEVESRPGAGTRVGLDLPLRRKGDFLPWSPSQS